MQTSVFQPCKDTKKHIIYLMLYKKTKLFTPQKQMYTIDYQLNATIQDKKRLYILVESFFVLYKCNLF